MVKKSKPKYIIRNQDNIDINVSNLDQYGIYLLEIVSDKEVDKVKVVIEQIRNPILYMVNDLHIKSSKGLYITIFEKMKKYYLFFLFTFYLFSCDDLNIDLIISYCSGEYSTANVLTDIDENIFNDDESVNAYSTILMDNRWFLIEFIKWKYVFRNTKS